MNYIIERLNSVDSTNTAAMDRVKKGADEGLCVVAGHQFAGRGRLGRRWISPPGAGLYLSIVLRPTTELRFLPLLGLMGAVAVFDTLRDLHGLDPDIKWPNDILVNEKKLSGILSETVETERGVAVIIGIGMNLDTVDFPADLKSTAGSIAAASGKAADREETLMFLLTRISDLYARFLSFDGVADTRREWIERSSYAFGKEVRAIIGSETIFGTTSGIDDNGALRIETANGEIIPVQAGDVEMVRSIA